MTDILQQVGVHVRCIRCDEEYEVSAEAIAESHRLLDEGCPGSSHECLPAFLAGLVDAASLENLSRAWEALERGAAAARSRPELHGRVEVDRRAQLEARWRALARWEDDGGALPAG